MFNYKKTKAYRVSVHFNETHPPKTEQVDHPYKQYVKHMKRNGEATLRDWAEDVIRSGNGHYCPDAYNVPNALSWLYTEKDEAQKVVDALTQDTVFRSYPHTISTQAPLLAMLGATVGVSQVKLPANIHSEWLHGMRGPLYSPSLSAKVMRCIVADPKCIVAAWVKSENPYGEFWFITIMHKAQVKLDRHARIGPWCMQFYGFGTNWNSGQYVGHWEHASTDQWLSGDIVPKRKKLMLKQMDHWINVRGEVERKPQTEGQALYEMLADLTDEDGAIAMMEDHNLWD